MLISTNGKLAYSPSEAMALLGIGKNTIYHMLANGELHGKRIGTRKWIIPRAELEAWLGKKENR